jgi:hypothetical protein
MLKDIYDRFIYALIGFVLGAVLAVILWLLYDKGFSLQLHWSQLHIHIGLTRWIKYCGTFFAIIGFIFKDGVGTAVGGVGAEVGRHEAYRPPFRYTLVTIAIVMAAVAWHHFRTVLQ